MTFGHAICGNAARDYSYAITASNSTAVAARIQFTETTVSPAATLTGTYDLNYAFASSEMRVTNVAASLSYGGATYTVDSTSLTKVIESSSRYRVSASGVIRRGTEEFSFATSASLPVGGTGWVLGLGFNF